MGFEILGGICNSQPQLVGSTLHGIFQGQSLIKLPVLFNTISKLIKSKARRATNGVEWLTNLNNIVSDTNENKKYKQSFIKQS